MDPQKLIDILKTAGPLIEQVSAFASQYAKDLPGKMETMTDEQKKELTPEKIKQLTDAAAELKSKVMQVREKRNNVWPG